MTMTEYTKAVKRGFRDQLNMTPTGGTEEDPLFNSIPDGVYPMTIDGKIDNVRIQDGGIICGKFADDEPAESTVPGICGKCGDTGRVQSTDSSLSMPCSCQTAGCEPPAIVEMTTPEIKPCPFCGEELCQDGPHYWHTMDADQCVLGCIQINPSQLGQWNQRQGKSDSDEPNGFQKMTIDPDGSLWQEKMIESDHHVTRQNAWALFAASSKYSAQTAANEADKLLAEFDKRFSDVQTDKKCEDDEL